MAEVGVDEAKDYQGTHSAVVNKVKHSNLLDISEIWNAFRLLYQFIEMEEVNNMLNMVSISCLPEDGVENKGKI